MNRDELHIRLPADEAALLRDIADREARTMTATVRLLLRPALMAHAKRLAAQRPQTPTPKQ